MIALNGADKQITQRFFDLAIGRLAVGERLAIEVVRQRLDGEAMVIVYLSRPGSPITLSKVFAIGLLKAMAFSVLTAAIDDSFSEFRTAVHRHAGEV